ncbi:MAG: geranylgeranylglyceryl/heptaprenylglyceryl phosphate synthase [Thalassobius sp.]|nr:geranylgeranylglyceryl/heptaprenylglyceryl phosphate synthase [Thalassovita sp.]
MKLSVYSIIKANQEKGKKSLALLLDPDKIDLQQIPQTIQLLNKISPDVLLIGGSLMLSDKLNKVVEVIKAETNFAVTLFPGNSLHISDKADAILFLSLISGRNPDFLIGQHVHAAPVIQRAGIEVIPTGYLLIDCGSVTTANYMSNTNPVPYNKPEIAACTALAGEMLGLKCMYLDGGSGAAKPISPEMIKLVKQTVSVPIVVGGGIRSVEAAQNAYKAGADMIVLGTIFENNTELATEIAAVREQLSVSIPSK